MGNYQYQLYNGGYTRGNLSYLSIAGLILFYVSCSWSIKEYDPCTCQGNFSLVHDELFICKICSKKYYNNLVISLPLPPFSMNSYLNNYNFPTNFSCVCRSFTAMRSRNHEPRAPDPLLSCQTRT